MLCGLLTGATLTGVIIASAAFTESPELRQLVEAGKLPPLDQRLPLAPLIITPIEKPGVYGGAWRMTLVGYDNNSMLTRSLAYEQLVRWDANWTRVLPNVASSWTINADATVYRFQLRRGMRWSDGVLFTAHDIVAWMDDVARDPELQPIPPAWLSVGGKLPECTAIDDTTLEFRFAQPNVLFLEQLAGMRSNDMTHYPAHYFRQWHQRYNPAGAAELMRRTSLAWSAAFRTIYTPWNWRHANIPTLNAWVLSNAYVPGVSTVQAVRNPYYWKIDTLGRQLPYLDTVTFEVVRDEREAMQRTLDGQVDYQRTDFSSVRDTAAVEIAAAEKAGHIRTVRVIPSRSNAIAICLNLTHQDPVMRAVLSDKRVRIALSEAIDRRAIIAKLYSGVGKPWQVAPRPTSPYYNRRLGEQYTDHTPEVSDQRLDEAGLHIRSSDGLRTLPDGRPFRLNICVRSPGSPAWTVMLDQVKADWLAIGVTMEWTLLPEEEFYRRIFENTHDGAVLKAVGGYTTILEPEFFVPASFESTDQAFYAVPWARWFINPQAVGAEKPPESVEKQQNLFRRVLLEPNREARAALMAQVLEMAADEFYVMGICLEPDRVAIRTPGFRNVPASHFDSWLYPDPGPFNPCQFYQEHPASSTR